jgi:hypothetical protein
VLADTALTRKETKPSFETIMVVPRTWQMVLGGKSSENFAGEGSTESAGDGLNEWTHSKGPISNSELNWGNCTGDQSRFR